MALYLDIVLSKNTINEEKQSNKQIHVENPLSLSPSPIFLAIWK